MFLPGLALFDYLSDVFASDTSGAGDLSVFGAAHGGTHDEPVAVVKQFGEVAVASVMFPRPLKFPRRLVEQFGLSPVHGHGLYIPTNL